MLFLLDVKLKKDFGTLRRTINIGNLEMTKRRDPKTDKDKEKRITRSNEAAQHLWKIQ